MSRMQSEVSIRVLGGAAHCGGVALDEIDPFLGEAAAELGRRAEGEAFSSSNGLDFQAEGFAGKVRGGGVESVRGPG